MHLMIGTKCGFKRGLTTTVKQNHTSIFLIRSKIITFDLRLKTETA
jgi:hypothetical protein